MNRFNLIDEPWIPVSDVGLVSLKEIFSNQGLKALGGNPVQKTALTKFLLAIAQSAYTPQNDQEWLELGAEGLAQACLEYLCKWYDRFYLYGDKPFLQMPAIEKAKIKSFGTGLPEIATGNTTVFTQIQMKKPFSDSEKALLVLQLMGFSLGGKKTDNTVVLTPGYIGKTNDKGKPSTGKVGTSLGFKGFLHNFIQGPSLIETIWINLLTINDLERRTCFNTVIGVPPREEMPSGEDDMIAQNLKASFIGRLVPVNRFVLLTDEGMHYSEGIAHLDYQDGMADPSISMNSSSTKRRVIWSDPEKRPWRILTALLSFISTTSHKDDYNCLQLELTLSRATKHMSELSLWSGGLCVSSNAGEQYVSGSDDFVESLIRLPVSEFGEPWFNHFQTEIDELNNCAKKLYACVLNYYKEMGSEGKNLGIKAQNLFWQLCETYAQELVLQVGNAEDRCRLRKIFAGLLYQVYERTCPMETARQIDAWAKCRPNLGKYISKNNRSAYE